MDKINEDLLTLQIGVGAHYGRIIEQKAQTQTTRSASTIEYNDNLLADEQSQASEQPKKRGRPKKLSASSDVEKSSSTNAQSAFTSTYLLRSRNKK